MYTTFYEMIEDMSINYPNSTIKFPDEDITWTYSEFFNKVNEYINKLYSIGIRKGDIVALYDENTSMNFICQYAIRAIGAVLLPINNELTSGEISYILNDSKPSAIITSSDSKKHAFCETIKEIQNSGEMPSSVKNIICSGSDEEKISSIGATKWEELNSDEELDISKIISQNDTCYDVDDWSDIQYTSGTTGNPKGVMLRESAILKNGYDIGERLGASCEDKLLLQVPMYHCFGIVLSMTAAMSHGSNIVVSRTFSTSKALKLIEEEGINWVNGVPSMWKWMDDVDENGKRNSDGLIISPAKHILRKRIQKGIMAGAACDATLMEKYQLQPVYGLTETSPGTTMSVIDKDTDYCSVGEVLPNVEISIRDENGNEVSDGIDGEICSRGYNTMIGYHNNPEATKETFFGDWLRTGDVGHIALMNAIKRTLYVTGRIKDMIIRNGENIFPEEIKKAINVAINSLITKGELPFNLPSIEIVGVKDVACGEEAVICIKKSDIIDGFPIENMINDILREICEIGILSSFKIPKYLVIYDGEYPMTGSGKVKKGELSTIVQPMVDNIASNVYQFRDGRTGFTLKPKGCGNPQPY